MALMVTELFWYEKKILACEEDCWVKTDKEVLKIES